MVNFPFEKERKRFISFTEGNSINTTWALLLLKKEGWWVWDGPKTENRLLLGGATNQL